MNAAPIAMLRRRMKDLVLSPVEGAKQYGAR